VSSQKSETEKGKTRRMQGANKHEGEMDEDEQILRSKKAIGDMEKLTGRRVDK
jgi:hypothetical protein